MRGVVVGIADGPKGEGHATAGIQAKHADDKEVDDPRDRDYSHDLLDVAPLENQTGDDKQHDQTALPVVQAARSRAARPTAEGSGDQHPTGKPRPVVRRPAAKRPP